MKPSKRIIIPAALLALAAIATSFTRGEADGDLPVVSGTVEATEARLGFHASGLLEAVAVREGDRVARGRSIAQLDSTELAARRQQAVAQAAAARAGLAELENGARREEIVQARAARDAVAERLREAERDLDRTRQLYEGGAVSREALDRAETAHGIAASQFRQASESARLVESGPRRERIEAQRAQVAQATAAVRALDATLERTVIRAPIDGIVTTRHAEPGEILAPGAPVVTLTDLADRWVRIYVPEHRIGAVRLGMRATLTADTYGDRSYPGEVSFISDVAEFTPKSVQTTEERVKLVYAVKVRITGDPGFDLKPGMPADVRLEAAPADGAAPARSGR